MEFEALYQRLMDSLEMHRDLSDAQILASIDSILSGSSCRVRLADRGRIRKELFNAVRRLDVLQELIDDDNYTITGITHNVLRAGRCTQALE